MKIFSSAIRHAASILAVSCALSTLAQAPGSPRGNGRPRPDDGQREVPPDFDGPPPFGPGDFGRGGPGGMMRQEIKLVKKFDKDGDKRLNAEERKAAREFLQNEIAQGRGRRGPGGPGGR